MRPEGLLGESARRVGRALLALTAAVLVALPVARGQAPEEPVPYRLADRTTFLEGCYPPCRCLLAAFPEVRGDFVLLPTGVDEEGFESYELREIDWTVPTAPPRRVTGRGVYLRRGVDRPEHRLELELVTDGGEPERHDSGLVPGGEDFPRIRIAAAVNGFFCFDRVYELDAAPAVTTFRRGDCNGDDGLDISDAVHALLSLFGGLPPASCADACDVDDDGRLEISDPIRLLGFLFLAGPPPPAPFRDCGPDETVDELGCDTPSAGCL